MHAHLSFVLSTHPLPPPPCPHPSPLSPLPPDIVTSLLNLAEFMEHDDKRLPLDTRTLGALAEKCHAFAKVRGGGEDRGKGGLGVLQGIGRGIVCGLHIGRFFTRAEGRCLCC